MAVYRKGNETGIDKTMQFHFFRFRSNLFSRFTLTPSLVLFSPAHESRYPRNEEKKKMKKNQ